MPHGRTGPSKRQMDAIDRQMDQRVYERYGLTVEQIRIGEEP